MGWQDHNSPVQGGNDESRSWRNPSVGRPAPDPRHVSAVTKARGKQLAASSMAVVAAAIFIFLLSLLNQGCSNTAVFVLTRDDYEIDKAGAIPPNWMAEPDKTSLQSLEVADRFRKLSMTSFATEKELQKPLQDVGKSKDSVCVMYLSCHAILEPLLDDPTKDSLKAPEADVVLLSKDDNLDPKTNRLRLSEVWGALKKLPQEQKKLLLLDINRLQGNWRLGVFDNFVLEGIEAAVQREKIPNLAVITACSSGETNWVSPHLGDSGQSVFGHFVSRGLAGEADGNSDKYITVRELFKFVHKGVNGWVKDHRDTEGGQHPQLFAFDLDVEKTLQAKEDKTFRIRAIGSKRNGESKPRTKSKSAPGDAIAPLQEQLAQLWKRRQSLEQPKQPANAIYHLDPVGFRALTQRLLRAEEFLVYSDTKHASTELEKANALYDKLKDLAQKGRFGAAEFSANEQFLRRLVDRYGLGSNSKTTASVPQTPTDPTVAKLPDEHLADVLSRAQQQHGMPAALKDDSDAKQCHEALVKLRQLAERVAFGHHTVLPWLRFDLTAADQLRREAEDRFFVAETAEAIDSQPTPTKNATGGTNNKSREILALADRATLKFNNLEKRALTLEQAQFVLNRACATLPDWLAFLSDRSTTNSLRTTRLAIMNQYHAPIREHQNLPPELLDKVGLTAKDNRPVEAIDKLDKDVLGVVLEAISLRGRLPARFGAVSPDFEKELATSTQKLTVLLDQVQQQFEQVAGALLNTSDPQPIHWRQMRDLLRCPSLEPNTRTGLLERLIHLPLSGSKKSARQVDLEVAAPNDRQTGVWQMLCSIHALSLVPDDPTGQANDKLWDEWHSLSVKEGRVRPEDLMAFSRKLRDRWKGHLAEASRNLGSWERSRELARNHLDRQDLFARNLFGSDAINLTEQPTREYERYLIAELLLDTSERYLDDFWKDWYSTTAKICFDASERLSGKRMEENRQHVKKIFDTRGKSELQLKADPVAFGLQRSAPGSISLNHMSGLPRGVATSWLAYSESGLKTSPQLSDLCLPRSVGLLVADNESSKSPGRLKIVLPTDPTPQKVGGCQPSIIVPKVFFRGHTWPKQSFATFNPCRAEGKLIRTIASPSTGAIRVTGEDRKSIVFVLDASGSMAKEGNEEKVDRWVPAKAILLDVLTDLQKKNRAAGADPHQVELIVYGHRDLTNPYKRDQVKSEIRMTSLNDVFIENVRKKLNQLTPDGSTPLLTAALQGCDSLKSSNSPGTVIVITDGVPNDGARYVPETARYDNADCRRVIELRKQQILEALEAARAQHREIELQVIGLGFGDKVTSDEAAARKELKDFLQKANQREGTLLLAEKFDDLRGVLNLSTGARHFFVGESGLRPNRISDTPLNQSLSGLTAGQYQLAFGYPELVRNGLPIEIHGGELLDFRLQRNGDLEHVHPQSLKESAAFRPASGRPGYRFGFLQSFKALEDRAEFVVGIQNVDSATNRLIPYTQRPERLVMEIQPNGQPLEEVQPTTYRIEPGKSDPTWTVQLDRWISGNSEAVIDAWANWERVPEDDLLKLSADSKWPTTTGIQLSKTRQVPFRVTVNTPANDRVELDDLVEVQLKLADPTVDAALFTGASNWRHLAYLHVQLRQDSRAIPQLNETAEVIASENEIRWKFTNLPRQGFEAKRLQIAITSWHKFELYALRLESPLKIKSD